MDSKELAKQELAELNKKKKEVQKRAEDEKRKTKLEINIIQEKIKEIEKYIGISSKPKKEKKEDSHKSNS